jgi:hypothetical protein
MKLTADLVPWKSADAAQLERSSEGCWRWTPASNRPSLPLMPYQLRTLDQYSHTENVWRGQRAPVKTAHQAGVFHPM